MRARPRLLLAIAGSGSARPVVQETHVARARRWVVLVDDLHLNFRHTGRIRAAIATVTRPLFDAGLLVGVRTDGPSSLALDLVPGAPWSVMSDALKRVTGNGLKASDIIQASGPRELVYRARHARLALETLVRAEAATPPVLLLVSNGYRTDVPEVSAQLTELAAAAGRARVRIVALDPRLFGDLDPDPPVVDRELAQHHRALADSLELLVRDTGGTMWRPLDDVASVLRRLR
jgi:hypothetical protein